MNDLAQLRPLDDADRQLLNKVPEITLYFWIIKIICTTVGDPTPAPAADLILMESTYGDRNHKDRTATVAELGSIFEKARADGGNVVIPAFAVGRSQELLYWFAEHFDDWNLAAW